MRDVWARAYDYMSGATKKALRKVGILAIDEDVVSGTMASRLLALSDRSAEPLRFVGDTVFFTNKDGTETAFRMNPESLDLVKQVHILTGEREDGVLAIRGEEHCTCADWDPFPCPKCESFRKGRENILREDAP